MIAPKDGAIVDAYFGGVPRYDDKAMDLMRNHAADAVVLVIVGGDRGHGALVKERAPTSPKIRHALARTLREMAAELTRTLA
jgi:hypothetical protein